MKKIEITGRSMNFHPSTRMRMTGQQYEKRKHNLKLIEAKAGEVTVEVVNMVQFKRGDVMWTDSDIPKSMLSAADVIDVDALVESEAPEGDENPDDPYEQYQKMTVSELKALCDERGIQYPSSDKKENLINYLVDYDLGDPEEDS